MDPQGVGVTLTESGNNTGPFTGHVGSNVFGSDEEADEVLVSDQSLVQVVYQDSNPLHAWRDSALWRHPDLPVDVDANGVVDTLDILAIASRFNASVADLDYSLAADLDDDGEVGLLDIIESALNFTSEL